LATGARAATHLGAAHISTCRVRTHTGSATVALLLRQYRGCDRE
jgi:hypothetical protein